VKYMLLLCDSDRSTYAHQTPAEAQKTYGAITKWWEGKEKQKVILGGEQLAGPDKATTVRSIGGKSVVTDGPFIEAKETIGGYALVEVPDLDAAIVLAKEWNGLLPGSTVEVRPLHQGQGM
jgi:hypothetical protein